MKKIICLSLFLFAGAVNAGTISNFSAVYDTNTLQLMYSFDLVSVDGTSPDGVNQLYFNYNPEINPFNTLTSVVSATSTGNSITYQTNDEYAILFDPLLNTTPISYHLLLNNVTTSELLAWDSLEVVINPTFIPGQSSLAGETRYLFAIDTHSAGNIPRVPESMSLTLLAFGLIGFGVSRKKKLA